MKPQVSASRKRIQIVSFAGRRRPDQIRSPSGLGSPVLEAAPQVVVGGPQCRSEAEGLEAGRAAAALLVAVGATPLDERVRTGHLAYVKRLGGRLDVGGPARKRLRSSLLGVPRYVQRCEPPHGSPSARPCWNPPSYRGDFPGPHDRSRTAGTART